MKEHLSQIRELYREQKYEEAISLIADNPELEVNNPAVLVWKARCLQMGEESVVRSLSDVESTLRSALDIDGEYLPALIDLAYFYLRVMDSASKALPLFKRALNIGLANTKEVILGLAETISETDSNEAALVFLDENRIIEINDAKLDSLQRELLECS